MHNEEKIMMVLALLQRGVAFSTADGSIRIRMEADESGVSRVVQRGAIFNVYRRDVAGACAVLLHGCLMPLGTDTPAGTAGQPV